MDMILRGLLIKYTWKHSLAIESGLVGLVKLSW